MFDKLFRKDKPIIAMLHVFWGSESSQRERLVADLEHLAPHVDGVIVENYGWGYADTLKATTDTRRRIGALTEFCVRRSNIPVGVNVLPNDAEGALEICEATGAKFIQLDHVTGEFVRAASLDRAWFFHLRKKYPAIAVLGGIHPKYYELKDPAPSLGSSASSARLLADAIVVTGEETGGETSLHDLAAVRKELMTYPLVVGSGLTARNAREQLTLADGAIVGSFLKNGNVENPIDPERVQELVAARDELVGDLVSMRTIWKWKKKKR